MAAFTTRLAGKALGDFLKAASGAVSGSAQRATADYLLRQRGASGLVGKMAQYPETISKIAGAAAPVAAAGGIAAGASLLGIGGRQQDSAGGRAPSFATQAYTPGSMPFTNEQMGESLLYQQRFQHQLQLIQARNAAGSRAGSLQNFGGVGDIMSLGQQIYG